jgi:hypothetical protein
MAPSTALLHPTPPLAPGHLHPPVWPAMVGPCWQAMVWDSHLIWSPLLTAFPLLAAAFESMCCRTRALITCYSMAAFASSYCILVDLEMLSCSDGG